MKIAYVLLFVFVQGFAVRAFTEFNLELHDIECIRKLNLSKSFVVKNFDVYNLMTENDEKFNNFVACSWTMAGYLTKKGNVNVDNIKKWLQKDLSLELNKHYNVTGDVLVDACKLIEGTDSGDTAVKVYNCMIRMLLKVILKLE